MSLNGFAALMPKMYRVTNPRDVIVMEQYLDSDTDIDVRIKNDKTMESIRNFTLNDKG